MINIFFTYDTHIKEIKVRHAKIKKRDFIYALSRIISLLSLSRDIFFYAFQINVCKLFAGATKFDIVLLP